MEEVVLFLLQAYSLPNLLPIADLCKVGFFFLLSETVIYMNCWNNGTSNYKCVCKLHKCTDFLLPDYIFNKQHYPTWSVLLNYAHLEGSLKEWCLDGWYGGRLFS